MKRLRSHDEMLQEAVARGMKNVAIAEAQYPEAILAAREAMDMGFAKCFLVGKVPAIERAAEEAGVSLEGLEVVDAPDPVSSALKTMELARDGKVHVVMKGQISSDLFLKAALDREKGIRGKDLLSHVGVFDVPGFDRLIMITDGGVNIAPTLEQKRYIVQHGIDVARALGIDPPRVALVAATEKVIPDYTATVEAAALSKMAERGIIKGGYVDGPLGLDNAILPKAARIKGIGGEVAGRADVLVAPDISAANLMAKAVTYFAGGVMAGIIVGAKAPIVLGSRSDPHRTRLVSMALGVLLASI
jgi:phosphate butyryltransferase